MKTKITRKDSALDDELFKIFSDLFSDNTELIHTVRDAKKAFSLISQDALYRDKFLDKNDEL